MNGAASVAALLGRILLSAIFLMSAFNKLSDPDRTAKGMAAKNMPAVGLLLPGAIALELGGGLSVLFGLKARWGAAALIIFLIPTTLIFHAFWADPGQMGNFMKNITILGGLLMVLAAGAGRFSLDGLIARRRRRRSGSTDTQLQV